MSTSAPALAVSIFLSTAAVAYARTGSPQQSLESLPTNTSLVFALFGLFGGALGSLRTRSPASFLVGHIFSALYILTFARLRAGLASAAGIGLLGSLVMAIGPVLTGWNPLPKELGYTGVYGVIVFGYAFLGVGRLLCLLFLMVLAVYWEDVKRIRERVDEAI